MGSLFGKPSSGQTKSSSKSSSGRGVSEKDRAVLQLKVTRDRLKKYQKKTDIEGEKLQKQAKEYIQSGRKDRALLALKIRKYKLKEISSVDAKLLNIVQMIEDIEWETQNIEVMRALEAGTAALDKLQKEMPVEEVERILEESAESIETQNEISNMLAGQFSEDDMSELEAQLDELEEMEESKKKRKESEFKMPDAPMTQILPDAPDHDLNRVEEDERNKDESLDAVMA